MSEERTAEKDTPAFPCQFPHCSSVCLLGQRTPALLCEEAARVFPPAEHVVGARNCTLWTGKPRSGEVCPVCPDVPVSTSVFPPEVTDA